MFKFNRIEFYLSLGEEKVKTARFLIENGADIHIEGYDNMTTLFIAASQGNFNYFKALFLKDKEKKMKN